jgi:hypothetical protein
MAAPGAIIIPDKAFLNIFNATNLLNTANTYKMSLHTSTWVPNDATNEVFADVTNELPTGGGYTAGGVTLGTDALTLTGSAIKFTSDPAAWVASGSGIPAWRHGVIRAVGTLNGKVDPIVGYFLGDTTAGGTDVPVTTSGNSLTVTPNASGLIGATKTP